MNVWCADFTFKKTFFGEYISDDIYMGTPSQHVLFTLDVGSQYSTLFESKSLLFPLMYTPATSKSMELVSGGITRDIVSFGYYQFMLQFDGPARSSNENSIAGAALGLGPTGAFATRYGINLEFTQENLVDTLKLSLFTRTRAGLSLSSTWTMGSTSWKLNKRLLVSDIETVFDINEKGIRIPFSVYEKIANTYIELDANSKVIIKGLHRLGNLLLKTHFDEKAIVIPSELVGCISSEGDCVTNVTVSRDESVITIGEVLLRCVHFLTLNRFSNPPVKVVHRSPNEYPPIEQLTSINHVPVCYSPIVVDNKIRYSQNPPPSDSQFVFPVFKGRLIAIPDAPFHLRVFDETADLVQKRMSTIVLSGHCTPGFGILVPGYDFFDIGLTTPDTRATCTLYIALDEHGDLRIESFPGFTTDIATGIETDIATDITTGRALTLSSSRSLPNSLDPMTHVMLWLSVDKNVSALVSIYFFLVESGHVFFSDKIGENIRVLRTFAALLDVLTSLNYKSKRGVFMMLILCLTHVYAWKAFAVNATYVAVLLRFLTMAWPTIEPVLQTIHHRVQLSNSS